MGKRLAQFLSATLRVPLWHAFAAALVAGAGLLALDELDAPEGVRSAQAALGLLWLAAIAVYFPARIFRHFSRRAMPMLEVLIIVGVFHALGLAALFWGPINNQTMRSYTAEFLDFDTPVLAAIFLSIWAFAFFMIALRYEKLGRFEAARTRFACAIGTCGALLLFALGAHGVIPQFESIYRGFGSDLPTSTLAMLAMDRYWYAIPLLGAIIAGVALLAPGSRVRIRKHAFDVLIGLVVVTNLGMVAGLIAMFLPIMKMGCATDSLWDMNMPDTRIARLHVAASLGREESVLRLISRGEPVNARDTSGYTPLLMALGSGSEKTARTLLAEGADVNAASGNGYTPLHAAVSAAGRSKSSPELVKLLLERGAEVNRAAVYSGTPLHVAARHGSTDVAALLLAKGADVNAVDTDSTPLDYVDEAKHDELIKLLLRHGAVRATKPAPGAKRAKTQASAARSGHSCG